MSIYGDLKQSKFPQVFFDIAIGKRDIGRLVFELYTDYTPKTAENFRALCTGERGMSTISNKRMHYKGCAFHRIITGFMAQGGDFTKGDGTGGESIYSPKFADENFIRKHDSAGLLSMANSGPNSNGSQFFITFRDTPHLDGRHVVFGKLISGLDILKVMERVSTDSNDKPRTTVVITDCGQIGLEEPSDVASGVSISIVSTKAGASAATSASVAGAKLEDSSVDNAFTRSDSEGQQKEQGQGIKGNSDEEDGK